jgi:hypothetical protein
MGLTIEPSTTSSVPSTTRRSTARASPATMRPTMSASLCAPATKCMSTSGLSTASHSALARSIPWGPASARRRPASRRRHRDEPEQRSRRAKGCGPTSAATPCSGAGSRPVRGRRLLTRAGRRRSGTSPGVRRRRSVRVQPSSMEQALGEVRVGVAAEQRRHEQQRGGPEGEDAQEPPLVALEVVEHVVAETSHACSSRATPAKTARRDRTSPAVVERMVATRGTSSEPVGGASPRRAPRGPAGCCRAGRGRRSAPWPGPAGPPRSGLRRAP